MGGGGALDYLLLDVGVKIRKHLVPLGLNQTVPLFVERNATIPILTNREGKS